MNNKLPDIHYLCELEYEDLIIKLAFNENANNIQINKLSKDEKPILIKAICKYNKNIFKLLLKHPNIQVNLQNIYELIAFNFARPNKIKALIKAKANKS